MEKNKLLLEIEDIYPEIKSDINSRKIDNETYKNLNKISKNLSMIFHKDISISLSDSVKLKSNKYFLMCVYPNSNILEEYTIALLNGDDLNEGEFIESWKNISSWTIEIDSKIFDNNYIDISSEEFVALLLHECGHVIFTDNIPHNVFTKTNLMYSDMDLGNKQIINLTPLKNFITVTIMKMCNSRAMLSLKNYLNETKADKMSIHYGYGFALKSVLEKIINFNINNKKITKNIDDVKQMDTLIDSLRARDRTATVNKFIMGLPPSKMMRDKLYNFESTILNEDGTPVSNDIYNKLSDTYNRIYDSAYTVEAFDLFKKKLSRIDNDVPDYVDIKSGSIQSNDDKLMLISYINSKVSLIDWYLSIINDPKARNNYKIFNSESELVSMRKRLLLAKDRIMAYKVPDFDYTLSIQYPTGYEG